MAQVKGDGVPSLYVAIIMMSLCWIIMIMRLGVRQYLHALGLDDLLMFIGLVRAVTNHLHREDRPLTYIP